MSRIIGTEKVSALKDLSPVDYQIIGLTYTATKAFELGTCHNGKGETR